MVALAYFVEDLVVIKYFIKPADDDKMSHQTVYHHLIGLICILCSVYGGYALPGLSCLAMLSEVSTIFLNYREMFDRSQRGVSTLYNVNFIAFLITFIICRMLLFPYCIYLACHDIKLTWDHVPIVRKTCIIVMLVLFVLIYALNIFWFKIILSITKKNLSPPQDSEKIDDDY